MTLQTQPTHQPESHLEPQRPVHFIGIGGIGMSGLAQVLHAYGLPVSGSDAKANGQTEKLQQQGVTVSVGHQAENLPDNALVVVSTAIPDSNPEWQKAQALGLSVLHRSDVLREVLQGPLLAHEITVGITGTHGKTTVTGMIGQILEEAGYDPTIVAGGVLPVIQSNAKPGRDRRYAVAELDESDGTIVRYQPSLTVINNLELDHPDHYQDGIRELLETFETFLTALGPRQKVLVNARCPLTYTLYNNFMAKGLPGPQWLWADDGEGEALYDGPIDYQLVNHQMGEFGAAYATLTYQGRELGELRPSVPGVHNLFNAMVSAVVGHQLEIPFHRIEQSIHAFSGMGRRFEKLGSLQGALLVDDYAHHPTEVLATLAAAREFMGDSMGRVIACFQPHRYSRLRTFWEDFRQAFQDADTVVLTDVYGAGEAPMEGVTSERLAQTLQHPHALYVPKDDGWQSLKHWIQTNAQPSDLILTMGAGDITQVGRGLLAE